MATTKGRTGKASDKHAGTWKVVFEVQSKRKLDEIEEKASMLVWIQRHVDEKLVGRKRRFLGQPEQHGGRWRE